MFSLIKRAVIQQALQIPAKQIIALSAPTMKYIWNEMTKSKGTPEKNRKAYMANVGAVGRGDINNVWVDQRLDSVNYVSGTIPLSWKCFVDTEEFEFCYMMTSKQKVVYYKDVKKKHINISEILKLFNLERPITGMQPLKVKLKIQQDIIYIIKQKMNSKPSLMQLRKSMVRKATQK
jgi:hypothetical protein